MRRFALILFGLLLGFAAAEIGLRLTTDDDFWRRYDTASPAESGRWQGHPFLPYIGRANTVLELKNGPDDVERIETNAYGFRSHEFPTQKGPDDLVVLCFGGSTTYGYKVESNEKTWPELLERMLAERYPDRNVRVYNLGLDMATTAVSVVNMALIGVHLQPDLVIVYHGYNDIAALGAANFKTDHSHFYSDLYMEEVWRGFQSALPRWTRNSYVLHYVTGALDVRLRTNDLAEEVTLPRVADPDRFKGMDATQQALRNIRSMAEGRGAEALFATFQFREGDAPPYKEFNDRLRAYLEAGDFHWVDQDALIPDRDESLQVDACHFTPDGREMLTRNFYDYIVENDLLR